MLLGFGGSCSSISFSSAEKLEGKVDEAYIEPETDLCDLEIISNAANPSESCRYQINFSQTAARLRLKRGLLTDIRLDYVKMISNIANMHEYLLIDSFWKIMFGRRPFHRSFIHNANEFSDYPGVTCTGINYGIACWCAALQLAADSIWRFSDPEIFERPFQRGSIIKANMYCESTNLYYLHSSEIAALYMKAGGCIPRKTSASTSPLLDDNDQHKCKKRAVENPLYGNDKCHFPPTEPLNWYIYSHGHPPKMLPIPMKDKAHGYILIFLNPQNRIQGVEFRAVNISRPLNEQE